MHKLIKEAVSYGKQEAAIKRLPDNPDKRIIWIVYNEDMVPWTENLFLKIKGPEYLKNVKVVSRDRSSKYVGHIYFDPVLYDLLGNGNV